ncbi:PLP-dependent aminotransferase family protein [Amycolatopsis cihanbeyliensis]|uniref:(S)-3,5-dihydroxyphenylglycine transaminase n=1 Tax=Amycolatopsis cihanbeyliensis TaxID=1128664 RepID=A0A542DE82_AMYCI|nr:PLP-dependent aminotransferase family protein [Amycolatopsis cihanbeyliensis]TQJ01362.1 (S)-3,5-dihydroxyphenylglycine transaminase [Amycolatopsis cihanbeyliensis]
MDEQGTRLSAAELHGSLSDPALTSMNFLNEVANHYPDAVSFAPGRPFEEFFDLDDLHSYLRTYCRYLAEERGLTPEQVRRSLFQYGRTKGVAHEVIARNLAVDEGIVVDPESVVVTVGCQEAMFLVMRALRAGPDDVLLSVSPAYVGVTGAARLLDMPVLPVRDGPAGIDLDDLVTQARQARASGRRPRALYVMPDFANPSGISMDLETRHRLLRVAGEEGLLVLEDNPYGLFHIDGERLPTLKALDDSDRVVYLGSYAKTAFPGARIGYAVADQRVLREEGQTSLFADELAKLKSMLTVNTAPIAQAMVAGMLLENGCSMVKGNLREIDIYARNMRHVLTGLTRRFPRDEGNGVSWNVPNGGFFVVVTVPFTVDDELLEYSAQRHGVLWTPMHHFYDGGAPLRQLRLSVSLLSPEQIESGLDRLAAMIADRVSRQDEESEA